MCITEVVGIPEGLRCPSDHFFASKIVLFCITLRT